MSVLTWSNIAFQTPDVDQHSMNKNNCMSRGV